MAKVTTGILVLRKGKSTLWTTDLDNQMIAWTQEYITWLETAEIAIEERDATKYALFLIIISSCSVPFFSKQQSRHFLLQPTCCLEGFGE